MFRVVSSLLFKTTPGSGRFEPEQLAAKRGHANYGLTSKLIETTKRKNKTAVTCGHGSKPRTPSEHPNPRKNRVTWVVHLPQNGTIGVDPQPCLTHAIHAEGRAGTLQE